MFQKHIPLWVHEKIVVVYHWALQKSFPREIEDWEKMSRAWENKQKLGIVFEEYEERNNL